MRSVLYDKKSAAETFDRLAAEYYNPAKHPTCANFAHASARLLRRCNLADGSGLRVLEVGCGRSLVAELFCDLGGSLSGLTLADSSTAMLSYSDAFAKLGAHRVIADAAHLPIDSDSMDLVVSSLGDPYNNSAFWQEAYRVMSPGGAGFFTTPSYEWACSFRREHQDRAEFELSDGTRLSISSLIYPESFQKAMIEGTGLRVAATSHAGLSILEGHTISPKLRFNKELQSIITLYQFGKPKAATRKNPEHA